MKTIKPINFYLKESLNEIKKEIKENELQKTQQENTQNIENIKETLSNEIAQNLKDNYFI